GLPDEGGPCCCQGCWPAAQPWATAVPSGATSVAHQRVLGCPDAALTRAWVSCVSSRPQPAASPGAVPQPRRVLAGTRRLIRAGNDADSPGCAGPAPLSGSPAGPGAGLSAFCAGSPSAPEAGSAWAPGGSLS